MDKLFGHLLAPRSERASTEAATEALDARKSDAHYFARIAIEYRRAGTVKILLTSSSLPDSYS